MMARNIAAPLAALLATAAAAQTPPLPPALPPMQQPVQQLPQQPPLQLLPDLDTSGGKAPSPATSPSKTSPANASVKPSASTSATSPPARAEEQAGDAAAPNAAVTDGAAAQSKADTTAGAEADADSETPAQREEKLLYREAVRMLSQGRPDEASRLLTRVIQGNDQHAGAWLDLAISQCELGNSAEAQRLFTQVGVRFPLSPAIVGLIESYRDSGCKAQAKPGGTFSYRITRGYDDNVNQGTSAQTYPIGGGIAEVDDDMKPRADHFTLVGADYVQPLGAGINAIAQFRAVRNDDVHELDTASLLLALESPWSAGNWRGRGTVVYGMVRLDGQLYQRQTQVQLRATPPLKLRDNLSWALLAGVSRVEYPTRNNYNASTLDLGSTLFYHTGRSDVVLSGGGLFDHGQALRPGGDRSGWYAGAQWYTRLGSRFNGELGWNHQRWLSKNVYSSLIDVVRQQDTRQVRAALVMPLPGRNSVQLEVRQVRNRENFSLFQYNSRMIQLSWRHDEY